MKGKVVGKKKGGKKKVTTKAEALAVLRQYRAQKAAQGERPSEGGTRQRSNAGDRNPVSRTLSRSKSHPEVVRERSPYNAYTDDTAAVGMGLAVKAFAAANGDYEKVRDIVERWIGEEYTPEGAHLLKSLTEGTFESLGALVQTVYHNEIIGLLRNLTVIRRAGARTLPMDGGNLVMTKIVGGTTAKYRGEGQSATPSGMTIAQMILTIKELVAQVPISKRLLRHASLAVDVLVRDDMVQTLALKEDLTFLRSAGSQFSPKGLRYQIASGNVVHAQGGAAPTLTQVRSTLSKAVLALKNKNVQMVKPAWIMDPTREEFLINLVDSNGRPVYEEEMIERGTLKGIDYFATNQVPGDLETGTGGGNESEITLTDFNEVFIGEDGTLELDVAKDVTYRDGNGNLVSAYDAGEIVVQGVQFHDFGMRYSEAGYVIDQCQWIP